MAFDISMIKATYDRLASRVEAARKATNKPLTASEKILYAHLWNKGKQSFVRGVDYVDLHQIESHVKTPLHRWHCCNLCRREIKSSGTNHGSL